MFNVRVMKIAYVMIALFNLCAPIYTTGYKFSLFQVVIPIIWFYGLLNGIGYFNQEVPILGIGLVRIFEGLFYYVVARGSFNWVLFIVFIVMDSLYSLFMYLDRNSYYYITEEEEGDQYAS